MLELFSIYFPSNECSSTISPKRPSGTVALLRACVLWTEKSFSFILTFLSTMFLAKLNNKLVQGKTKVPSQVVTSTPLIALTVNCCDWGMYTRGIGRILTQKGSFQEISCECSENISICPTFPTFFHTIQHSFYVL